MAIGRAAADRPVSIKLFAWLFGLSALLSLALAVTGPRQATFSFAIAPDAARLLAMRILAVRLFGIAFALSLLVMIVFGRSRNARGALVLRWLLGLCTSALFLRGIGLVPPTGAAAPTLLAASAVQLAIEALAILILFGEDAAGWFDRKPGCQ